jgi:phenylalanyl-tRNA synthetase beta chain
MVSILRRLHIEVELSGDTLSDTAPEFRQDIEQEADICEEVLRMAGYDRIPSTLMQGRTMPGFDSESRLRQKALAVLLNGQGYDEIYNYSFFGTKQLDSLRLEEGDPRLDALRIRNPLGEDTALMRTSPVPDMLATLALNMARGNEKALLYEFVTLFSNKPGEGTPYEEQPWLCLGRYGEGSDFYALRDSVLLLLERMGIPYMITAQAQPYLHPGRSATITSNGALIARVGEVHPAVCEACGMDDRAFVAELDLSAFWAAATPMPPVKDLPRMPAVSRDIALVLDAAQELMPVMEAVRRAGGALLEEVRLFDVYRGAQLPPDKKSCAFSLSFRAPDRSLEEKEITALMEKVQRSVKAQFGAQVRS